MVFDKGIKLLDHYQLVHHCGELADEFLGEGIDGYQLKEAGVRENLTGVLVGNPTGYDARS